MDWSNLIKKLRNKMFMTQSEFAYYIGVSYLSVNRYENNKSVPTMKIKRKLNELFIQYGILRGNGEISDD